MRIHYPEGVEILEAPRDPWRDVVLGLAAGAVGTLAMNGFWKVMAAVQGGDDDGESGDDGNGGEGGNDGEGGDARDRDDDPGPLDDIAVVGPYHREDESAPETLGRVVYSKLRGREPDDDTRAALANRIHWGTGMALGALWGLARGDAGGGADLVGGVLFGTGAWFLNDEVLVPALGLSEGPTAMPAEVHLGALGAHVVYGVAAGVTLQLLERAL